MSTERSKENAETIADDLDPTSILRIWNKIVVVIIGFFSSFIFNEIRQLSNQLEVIIITIILFLTWIMIDNYTRARLSKIWTLVGNKSWQSVILEMMDFIYSLGIFLVVQFLLSLFSDEMGESNLSAGEKAVSIYAIVVVTFSTFQTLKILS